MPRAGTDGEDSALAEIVNRLASTPLPSTLSKNDMRPALVELLTIQAPHSRQGPDMTNPAAVGKFTGTAFAGIPAT